MNNEVEEILAKDDWELQWIRKHKQSPLVYPIDRPKIVSYLNEILCDCESGMALGENWHGGMSRDEWKHRKEYIETVLKEMDTL